MAMDVNYLRENSILQTLEKDHDDTNHDRIVRGLVIMDALIEGGPKDYDSIVCVQKKETLTFWTFSSLHAFFYVFKMKPDLREVLENFILLDGYSRSRHADRHLANLPENHRQPKNREEMILSFIKYGIVPEVSRLNLHQIDTLRCAFKYRELVKEADGDRAEIARFSDDEKRIVMAGVVCDIASLVSLARFNGSMTLGENMAKNLLYLVEHSAEFDSVQAMCRLTD